MIAAPLPPPNPLELSGVSRRAAALDLGLIVLSALLVPMGFEFVALAMTGGSPIEPEQVALLPVRRWFDIALVGGLLAYLALRHHVPWRAFGLTAERPGRQAVWALANLASLYVWLGVTAVIGLLLMPLFGNVEDAMRERLKTFDAFPIDNLGKIVMLLVPVAIYEEVLFRGLLLPYVRRLVGSWWLAIVIVTAVFAIMHLYQGWAAVLQILGIGALLAVFFVRSRSLPVVIVAHFLFNFLQFQLIGLVQRYAPLG